MSYVAISGEVMEGVVRNATQNPDRQIVGVLLGGQFGDRLLVDGATTGPSQSDATHVTLSGDSMAKIADDIINKRVRGSIVGWYHSHVRGGVFMSETDVETQLKLQQFSPMVVAMVIDAQTGRAGFFRADSKTKGAIPVRQEAPTRQVPMAPQAAQAYYPQAPQQPAPLPISTRTIILAVILITLAVTGGILALAYYRPISGSGGNLAIKHDTPRGPFVIANPITFDANVTGANLQNVTLSYRVLKQAPTGGGLIIGDLVDVPMLLKAAGKDTYSYTVPSSEVSGLYFYYYISAFDTSSNVARSNVYTLDVGDFDWTIDKTDEIVVVRTRSATVDLPLDPINKFSKAVTIRIAGSAPAGVSVRPVSAQVTPPASARLQITSTGDAELARRFEIEVDAVYTPATGSAVQIIRPIILVLTVTDFDFDVTPAYQKIVRTSTDKDVTYTMPLTVYDGFVAPSGFLVTINGLPEKTSWKLVFVGYVIGNDQKTLMTYNLVITVESGAKKALYLFNVIITANGIMHDKTNIQLEIA